MHACRSTLEDPTQAKFADVRVRMEGLLRERGIERPDRWLATAGQDLDAALAEAVTLAVNDTVLGELVSKLDNRARLLLVGAAVYRRSVDEVGLAWQVGTEIEVEPDPARDARLDELGRRLEAAGQRTGLRELGYTATESAQLGQDWVAVNAPPLTDIDDVPELVDMLARIGLIAPILEDTDVSFAVHRWTAHALAAMFHDETAAAHGRAARFREWCSTFTGQDRVAQMEDIYEARFHHYVAGNLGRAIGLSDALRTQWQIWGAWDREEQLCLETLAWLGDERLHDQAAFIHQLGLIAQRRGDYPTAEDHLRRSLAINEELGNRAGIAAALHQLGILAQDRGQYPTAEDHYHRSLAIKEELGNRAGIALTLHQLGFLTQLRGDYATAEDHFRRSLAINKDLGNRAGVAGGLHHLGMLAQRRGDYPTAEDHYHRSLAINEELGNRAGIAITLHQLGLLARHHDEYRTAEDHYHRSLAIKEELGNRVGIAVTLHELGMLAQTRGDYPTAEDHYHRSLAINEELGNRVGIALTTGQLGVLAADQGNVAGGVTFHLRALAIHLEIGGPEAGIDLHWLAKGRRELGDARFLEILNEHLDPESVTNLLEMLDDQPSTSD